MHRYFKAGLIRVFRNPDDGPVQVEVTALGEAQGVRLRIGKERCYIVISLKTREP